MYLSRLERFVTYLGIVYRQTRPPPNPTSHPSASSSSTGEKLYAPGSQIICRRGVRRFLRYAFSSVARARNRSSESTRSDATRRDAHLRKEEVCFPLLHLRYTEKSIELQTRSPNTFQRLFPTFQCIRQFRRSRSARARVSRSLGVRSDIGYEM